MDRASAADVLFSRTQQRILRALYAGPAGSQGLPYSELLRVTSAGSGGIHRELQQFVRAGLVRERYVASRRFYLPNEAHPIHEELKGIARKLLGIPAALKEALQPFAEELDYAFIYGSIARNADDAHSDVDVMVVGAAPMGEVLAAVQALEPAFGRHISVRFYEPGEYRRARGTDPFLRRVEAGPTIELLRRVAPESKAARSKRGRER